MFRDKERKFPKYFSKKKESKSKEFRAVIDKNTSLVIIEQANKNHVVVKRELLDYKLDVFASEAPIKNHISDAEILPYEYVVAERAILEKEIIGVNEVIKKLFGKKYDLRLKSIRLCIGDEEDYLTIDESDLKEVDVTPTLSGLNAFLQTNKKSIFGFTIRHYQPKKGNLVFCECELTHPIYDIRSIKIIILASLSQRGLYMQKHHQGYGLHLYYILKINAFSDAVIRFFNELEIPIEMIYLKRKSSIHHWRSIECELDERNLKNYLQHQYNSLSHSDVEHIVAIVRENKFNFESANLMAEILNKMKNKRIEIDAGLIALEREDIAAAAKWVVNYFGFDEDHLALPQNLDSNVVKRSIDELEHLIKKSIDRLDLI